MLANGETIGWPSNGIKALSVNVPLQAPSPIEPIKGIDIDYLSLVFDQEQPWNPVTFSQALTGQIGLPFGFSLDIISTSNEIGLTYANQTVANIAGAFSQLDHSSLARQRRLHCRYARPDATANSPDLVGRQYRAGARELCQL